MSVQNNSILDSIRGKSAQKIIGKNLLVKKVFDFFVTQYVNQEFFFVLCTTSGLIISSSVEDVQNDKTGYLFDLEVLPEIEENYYVNNFLNDYIVFSHKAENERINKICSSAAEILKIFFENDAEYFKLLYTLDCIKNSVLMCDKDANITFANSTCCKNLNVKNRDEIIGMNYLEAMRQTGTQIRAIETNSSDLKMMEVLKTGEAALDWAVRMEYKNKSNHMRIVSNDMFPVFDGKGDVWGSVEISRSQQQEIKQTRKIMGLSAEYVFDDVVGNSNVMYKKIQLAKEFAGNRGTVLITGESGVGKEIFAQSIHNYSVRSTGPFVALNCANFPAELIESELFGYVQGAFTGASKKGQIGKIELADGGTLFLDEIGELPYYFQSKLLRVLETWMVRRIGDSKEIPVDVRLIAATNRDLTKMIQDGLFREDLYYRLQVLTIELPSLRERLEDIPLIAEHFLKISAKQNGHPPKLLADNAKRKLMKYNWPGNARELKNLMSRIDLLCKSEIIDGETIESALFQKDSRLRLDSSKSEEERINDRKNDIDMAYANLLNEALDITKGNKKDAAELLGISRKTIYTMLEKYNVK